MRPAPGEAGPLEAIRLGRGLPVALGVVVAGGLLAWRLLPIGAADLVATVVVCTAVLVAGTAIRALAAARGAEGSPFDAVSKADPPEVPDRPRELIGIERMVSSALSTAADAHVRLRPLLRAVLVPQLAEPDEPEAPAPASASQAAIDAVLAGEQAGVGPVLWDLVRPGRPRPERWDAPGLDAASLVGIVEELEARADDR